MANTSRSRRKSARDIAYYTQRYRNRVFSKLVSFIAEQCEAQKLTKKDLAEIIGKDPGLVSRWLSQPGNLTLDTISELAFACDAEPEPPDFIRFGDRLLSNVVHPLIARVTNLKREPVNAQAYSTATIAHLPVDEAEIYQRHNIRVRAIASSVG
jgi:transcriptional regulator with XRE-family HTH domain